MSKRYDDARRGIEAASQALARLRRDSGAEEQAPDGEASSAAGLRAALDAARRALEDKARELESAQARVRELERERTELLAQSAGARSDPALAERAQRAEAEALKIKQAAAAETGAMNGRLSMQQAEFVRLNSLRRKAEEAASQSELTRRDVEEALRRDLRAVHSSLDRAAAEAGAREARAQSDIQGLTRRLEAALTRTEQLSREQQAERERWRAERNRLAVTLQRSTAVHAALRREIADLRRGLDLGVEELSRRLSVSEAELVRSGDGQARAEELAKRLAASEAALAEAQAGQDTRAENLVLRLAASESELAKVLAGQNARVEELSRLLASSEPELWKARAGEDALTAEIARLTRRLADAETQQSQSQAGESVRSAEIAGRLAATQRELAKALGAQDVRTEELARLTRSLAESESELARARADREALVAHLAALGPERSAARSADDAQAADLARSLSESVSTMASVRAAPPDAAAIVARLRPAATAAYERLRELSALVPLSDAESASLRSAASAVAGLSDTVGLVARYLDDGPAGAPGLVGPLLDRAAADWTAAFTRKECGLTVESDKDLSRAVFDPADLGLVLDQLLRRSFETLPSRSKLTITARREGEAVEVILQDNGPVPSARDEALLFELGPDFTGLALPLARRLLRRWGGDARYEKSAGSSRLVLTLLAA